MTAQPTPALAVADIAQRWAVVSLAVTLGTGAWLRMALAWPALLVGANPVHAMHAHSHGAFFGWLVLAAASLRLRAIGPLASDRIARVVVHGIGVLSVLAVIGFARVGYARPTIVLSAVHVALWFVLALLLYRRGDGRTVMGRWWRTTWALLLVSGAVTTVPAILAARGLHTGWWRDLGITLFLALFVNGFALLTAIGLLLEPAPMEASGIQGVGPGVDAWRRLYLVGLPPLAVLYVAAPAPWPWLTVLAHIGVGIVGVATSGLAWQLRRRGSTFSIMGLTTIGLLQLIAATSGVDALLHSRPIVVAFTHLELLLVVTPTLAIALAPSLSASAWLRTGLWLGAAMCATLVVAGWPWLTSMAAHMGLPFSLWYPAAGVVGASAALMLLRALPGLFASPVSNHTPHGGAL